MQVGQAGGNVTVIHQTHHHYPERDAPTRQTLLVLPVYELHQLPRRPANFTTQPADGREN